MHHRATESILAEWRTLERALESAMDAQERIDLARAIATLTDEYRGAVDAAAAPEAARRGSR